METFEPERRLLAELVRLDLDTEVLVEAVADVLDRLDRLLDAGGAPADLRDTANMLETVLTAHGAVELIGGPGEPAAPQTHHVVEVTDTADRPADAVVKVVRRGIRYRGTLLRPASVIVSARSSGTSEKGTQS
jgi:molecular chaperone GrpE (heat shock protein)